MIACRLLLMRFAMWYIANQCRSPPERAAVPQICLRMQRDLNAGNPRMRGWIQGSRSLFTLTANNAMSRVPQQVFKFPEHDLVDSEH